MYAINPDEALMTVCYKAGSSGHLEQSGQKTGHIGGKKNYLQNEKGKYSFLFPLVPLFSCMHTTFHVLIELYVGKHHLDDLLLKEF